MSGFKLKCYSCLCVKAFRTQTQMWKGKVIFMKKLIRKTLAGICFATLIIAGLTGMTACGNKTSDGGQTDVD